MSTRPNLSPEHLIGQGWSVFKSRPWLCIAMFLLYWFTQPGNGGSGGSGGGSLNDLTSMSQATAMITTAVLAGFGLISLLVLLIAGPMRGGYDLAMLRMVRGDQSVSFADLFAGFPKFINLMLTMLLGALIVATGVLFCVVPGVIAGIGLWPAYLLVMEDDLGPVDAIKGAWRLTNGHKMELFILGLANFVLVIAGLLTCCVGLLVAGPVAQLAWMGAYDELRRARVAIPALHRGEPPGPAVDPTVGNPAPPALGPGDEHKDEDDEPTIGGPNQRGA